MTLRTTILALAILALPALSAAHGTHQHGVAHVDAVVDATGFELALTADGEGIVGFEHAAETPDERAAIDRATQALRAGAAIVSAAAGAACTLETAQVQPPYQSGTAKGGHADWTASYRFTCGDAGAITGLDFSGLFTAFRGVETLKLQLVSDRGQTGAELTPAQPRAALVAP